MYKLQVTPDDGRIKAETLGYSENLFISAFVGWMSECNLMFQMTIHLITPLRFLVETQFVFCELGTKSL
jgi:hypothetical protein